MTENNPTISDEVAAAHDKVTKADTASLSDEPGKVFKETNSSGDSNDPLNTPEDRLEADPALEPELARKREEEALERADDASGELETTSRRSPTRKKKK